ncbi:MAG TPA: NAD(+) synthase [Planctomycetota bacterium]|jgi:NAD+ synthase|nr:NAD(+) synthase [Planctomycetota bacterium]OQC21670.1 MAG: NH(3)-dependent NAD(+) synthetase [Planctomycetes bacterium ADurb.Bin069]NMD36660.1 NAD(+) synthase [Planctomycetota bacterium]HNS00563.1 NAD(+) synthase [Planctomycetota bacterium]HNU26455.1 NAD(+) synthase [Planctomycetota bacterium]
MAFSREVLELDCAAETARICEELRRALRDPLRRRGLVVATSGGIDSTVCAALAVRALGPRNVATLVMPERDSSPRSKERGLALAAHLGLEPIVEDIAPALEAIGCYRRRDEAIRRVFPEYGPGWKNKITISGSIDESDRVNYFRLHVEDPQGRESVRRLPLEPYLQIVASTNFKQRIRKTLEYFHADRLNYAVAGTPNRLEYDQGFFVKNGDGAADIKPIAHLYKTQVYALAAHLGLPEDLRSVRPTTDTYSMPQGQDEFYFVLPYEQMDLALWAHNHAVPAREAAAVLGLTPAQIERVYRDIEGKRRTTRYLQLPPLLLGDVPEIKK